jgi:hypothetical protein
MLRCDLTNKDEYWGCGRWCACLTHDSFLQRADYVLLGGDSLEHVDYGQLGGLCQEHVDYGQLGGLCQEHVDYGQLGAGCQLQDSVLSTLRGGGKTPTYDIQLCRAPSYPSCQRHLA